MKKLRNRIKWQKGQVAVEYILLLLVIVTIFTTISKRVADYFLSDDGTCSDPDSKALVCQFKSSALSNFRYYVLRQ